MKNVHEIIQELRSDNSRLFKESVLKREINNKQLKRVISVALDPFTQFYIRKIPAYEFKFEIFTIDEAIDKLTDLSSRKVTGHAGVAHLKSVLESVNPDDAEVIKLIIAKDLKCGVSSATVNNVWPGIIQERVYMRCSGFKDLKKAKVDFSKGVYSQIKSDGIFASITHTEDGRVVICTRAGNQFNNNQFTDIVKEIQLFTTPGHQFHGELLVEEDGEILPRQTGNGFLNSVLKDGSFGIGCRPVFVCWDMIPLTSAVTDGVCEIPYSTRFANVSEAFISSSSISPAETRIVYSMEEVMDHYAELIDLGHEGSVVKTSDAIWMDGTSKQQFKIKVDFSVDLVVVGFNPGNGKNEKTFGSMKCLSSDGKLEVNISGIKDNVREELWAQRELYESGTVIVEVKSNCITKSKKEGGKYSLFHPRFIEVRTDKTEADSLQRIQDQYESVVKSSK